MDEQYQVAADAEASIAELALILQEQDDLSLAEVVAALRRVADRLGRIEGRGA